mgnify:CR=1 FL=1
MNSFDSMIERYKKELIDAKRRSIEKEIVETSAAPVFSETEPEASAAPVFSETEPETSAKPVFSETEPETSAAPVFSETEPETSAKPVFAAASDTRPEVEETDILRETLGLKNPREALSEKTAAEEPKNEPKAAPAEERPEGKNNFQSESDIPDDNGAVFEENEPFPESLGALKVQVFMANRAYPVSSAHVVITGKDNKKVYFDGYTNTNGIVGSLLLPAPKKVFSQSPQENPPYAQYDITVFHPMFQKRQYLGVPVFSGVESIQNIQLLPLGTDEADTDVTESEPNELLMKGGESNA